MSCPPATATKSLQVLVSQLRKSLAAAGPDPISTGSGPYMFWLAPLNGRSNGKRNSRFATSIRLPSRRSNADARLSMMVTSCPARPS